MTPRDGAIADIFAVEARDTLVALNRRLLELETTAPGPARDDLVRVLFRLAHTLKGAASTAGFEQPASLAHALEWSLDKVRSGQLSPSRGLIDAALSTVDLLQVAVASELSGEEVEAAVARLQAAAGEAPGVVPKPTRKRAAKAKAEPPAVAQQVSDLFALLAAVAQGKADAGLGALAEACAGIEASCPLERPDSKRLAGALRGYLVRAAEARTEVTPALVSPALLAADLLQNVLLGTAGDAEVDALIRTLSGTTAPARPAEERRAVPRSGAQESETWVRVPVSLLNSVLFRLDELVALKLRLDFQKRQIEDVQQALERRVVEGEAPVAQAAQPQAGTTEPVNRKLEAVRRSMAEELHSLGMLSQALLEDIKQVRMVPIGPFLEPFRRVTRDLARSLGKDAVLEIRGEDVRVDRSLLEDLRDPLNHLLRNAVDHGLESPEERAHAGKPATGQIVLTVEARESQLWMELRDDGRGIQVERIRQVAVERSLIEPERARQLTERELLNLIFTPGFSTARSVTELSGRGVGLDVVREGVAKLGGRIEFYSQAGLGSQFHLHLPLMLAASRGLIVTAGRHLYCIPLVAVEEVLVAEGAEVALVQGHLAIRRRRQAIPYAPLSDLLAGSASAPPRGRCPTVVLALSERRLALGVDELHGQEEVVTKSTVPGTPRLPFVAGATSLSDGRLVTVLEPSALMNAAARLSASVAPAPAQRRAPVVLVVDDSLTTRSLVSSVLQRAGYQTVLATDGLAALAALRDQAVDLVVSDVEMPGMDGIELVRQLRGSASFDKLPVVLLTSVDGPAERARGAEAGANAYVIKREFEPSSFLSLVGELLGEDEA